MIRYFSTYVRHIKIFLISSSLMYCTSASEVSSPPVKNTALPLQPTESTTEDIEKNAQEEDMKIASAREGIQPKLQEDSIQKEIIEQEKITAAHYSKMTDEEKIAQLLIIHVNIPSKYNDAEFAKIYARIRDIKPGGVILFNNSLHSSKDLRMFIYKLQQNSTIPLFVSADIEGGTVNRLRNLDDSLLATIPSQREMTLKYTPEELKAYAFQIGQRLLALGINMNLAPVADIRSSITPEFLVERTFSDTPENTARYVDAYISGLQSAKVMAVIKHFPGHGSATGDTHFFQVKIHSSKEDIHNNDMLPFRYAVTQNVSSVMLGHMIVPAIDKDNSASASEKIISILKTNLNFNGLIMTDSLKMKGITRNNTSFNVETTMINAGVDILLDPIDPRQLIKNLLQDLDDNTLSRERIQESVMKILRYKYLNNMMLIN